METTAEKIQSTEMMTYQDQSGKNSTQRNQTEGLRSPKQGIRFGKSFS